MSVCGNCLRWLRHLKRGDGKGYSDNGTCWLDGIRTQGNHTCGFHSDNYAIREGEPLPPGQDSPERKTKLARRTRTRGVGTGGWL